MKESLRASRPRQFTSWKVSNMLDGFAERQKARDEERAKRSAAQLARKKRQKEQPQSAKVREYIISRMSRSLEF
jgi:hypothetical protein